MRELPSVAAEDGDADASGLEASKPSLEERLSEDRTVFSAERTYMSWLRTGLSFLVAGIAAEKLFTSGVPGVVVGSFATVVTLCAAACFAAAAWRIKTARRDFAAFAARRPSDALTLSMAVVLLAASLAASVGLWLI